MEACKTVKTRTREEILAWWHKARERNEADSGYYNGECD